MVRARRGRSKKLIEEEPKRTAAKPRTGGLQDRRSYLEAHLGYLETELPKYEGSKPEEAARIKERIKNTKRELAGK